MNQENRRFTFSILVAGLLHALLLMSAVLWLPIAPSPRTMPPLPIVYLVSPPGPEQEPKKPDALAEENRQTLHTTQPRDMPPMMAPPSYTASHPTTGAALSLSQPIMQASLPKPRPRPRRVIRSPEKSGTILLLEAALHAVAPSGGRPQASDTPLSSQAIPPPFPPQEENQPPPEAQPAPLTFMPQEDDQEAPPEAQPAPLTFMPQEDDQPPPEAQPAPLTLMPSLETLSRWDRQRRYQSLSTHRTEETVSLNTRKVRYAAYFSRLKERVEHGWGYPAQARKEHLSGHASLVFTIHRNGHLLDVRVLRSSGAAILDASAVRAVKNAAPFAPFPKDWSLEKLHIRATFEYIRRGELMWQH